MKKILLVILLSIVLSLIPMKTMAMSVTPIEVSTYDELKVAIDAGKFPITIKDGATIDGAFYSISVPANVAGDMIVINGKDIKIQNLTFNMEGRARFLYATNSNIILEKVVVKNSTSVKSTKNAEGGGIFSLGGSLTIKNSTFLNNISQKDDSINNNADSLAHGGAIYMNKGVHNIIDSKFENNKAHNSGGAIYIDGDANTELNISGRRGLPLEGKYAYIYTDSKFIGNDLQMYVLNKETGQNEFNHSAQGGAIYIGPNVKSAISNTRFEIGFGFNAGGAIRYLFSRDSSITNCDFKIPKFEGEFPLTTYGDANGTSGGALAIQGTNVSIDKSLFDASQTDRKMRFAGGFITILQGGKFDLLNSDLIGRGAWHNGPRLATYGGAIAFESPDTNLDGNGSLIRAPEMAANISNTSFKNIMADVTGGAISVGTKVDSLPTNVDLTLNNVSIDNTRTLYWDDVNHVGGSIFIGEGNKVDILGDSNITNAVSNRGGLIYSAGELNISGSSSLSNGWAFKLGGGIYNNGDLTIDKATLSNNNTEDSNSGTHPQKTNEYSGRNIYAEKPVTVTPNANLEANKDVRVLDGKSWINLTGAIERPIYVSISEKALTENNSLETMERYIGYTVARGQGYTLSESDAQLLHYFSKPETETPYNQPVAVIDDHESIGKWDFVLNSNDYTIVVGQRAKAYFHANGGKFDGGNIDKEQPLIVYSSSQKLSVKAEEIPTREGYKFLGWFTEPIKANSTEAERTGKEFGSRSFGDGRGSNVTNNEEFALNLLKSIFELKVVKAASGDITNILDPAEIHAYAAWTKVIQVKKVWDDNNNEFNNRTESVTIDLLAEGQVVEQKILSADENWIGVFDYELTEENINKTYTVSEEKITGYKDPIISGDKDTGFTVTNSTEFMTVEGKKIWVHRGNESETKPTSVTVTLLENGQKTENTTTGNSWTFENLPKYKNRMEVNYTIEESPVENYTTTYSGYNVTNTYTNKYNVIFEFISGGSEKELPQEVKNQKPINLTDQEDGQEIVYANSFSPVEINNGETLLGTWTFRGWDKVSPQTIKGEDLKVIGTWTFTEKEQNPDPIPEITTAYIDENYHNLLPSKTGKQGLERIEGYDYIRTEIDKDGNIFHIYKKSEIFIDPWIIFGDPNPVSDDSLLNKEDHKAYMFGYPDWTFKQDTNMTRAEATAMFARLLKNYPREKRVYNINYPDVAYDHWHYEAVGFMTENKIVEGYEDGYFRPDAEVTRAEFATMASRFDDLVGGRISFSDVDSNHWAYSYIVSAANRGWVEGYPDETFKPNQDITRAEVVTVTNRMLNRYADEEFVDYLIEEITNFKDLDSSHWAYYNIQEATNGHDYTILENGKDERWIVLNGQEFNFAVEGYK